MQQRFASLGESIEARIQSDEYLGLVRKAFRAWDEYHEAHFSVVREVFQNPGSTRYEIWTNLYGDTPRLIRDLSTGGVVRQERDTNALGQCVRKTPQRRRRGTAPTTMESAFEDTKPYILTELGKQFVHYTMNEVVTRIGEERGRQ